MAIMLVAPKNDVEIYNSTIYHTKYYIQIENIHLRGTMIPASRILNTCFLFVIYMTWASIKFADKTRYS